MVEEELGLQCERCGAVHVFYHVREKEGKKCRYCDNEELYIVPVLIPDRKVVVP